MNDEQKRLVSVILVFLWLVGIVVSYYVSHKPFSPALALSLAKIFSQISIAFVILSVGGGLGRRLLPGLEVGSLARLSLDATLGLGILGIGVLVVGALVGLHLTIGWGVLLLLAGVLRRDILRWWRDWRDLYPVWRDGGRLGRAIALGLSLIFLFTLVSALAPPLKFDALVYHLTFPRMYISAGRVFYVHENMFWGMPQAVEMLYTWAMMLAGDSAAVLLGWGFGLLALVGLLGYVAERLGARPAWVSLASLMSGFALASALSWGYVDWLMVLCGVAFLIALDLWMGTHRRRDLLLAGVFAGLAIGAKYTAGVLLFCGLAAILWTRKGRLQKVSLFASLFQFTLVVGVVTLPWLIKNLLATGNPIYPFFFPSGAMSQLRLDLSHGGEPWGGWLDVILLPVRATFYGLEGAPGYSVSIGPLLLGLSLAAWLGWSSLSEAHRTTVTRAALIVIPGILTWIVIGRISSYLLQSRLYFAIFPAWAVLAGAGFSSLSQFNLPGVRLGRIVGFMVVFVLALNVFDIGIHTIREGAAQAALGLNNSEEHLGNNLGWYAPTMKYIRDLPEGTRVLMLWEPRSLHCWPKCEPDVILDRWLSERYTRDPSSPLSVEEILDSWIQSGYTHLLFYRLGVDFVRSESSSYGSGYHDSDWRALYDLLDQIEFVRDFGGTYTLYELDR